LGESSTIYPAGDAGDNDDGDDDFFLFSFKLSLAQYYISCDHINMVHHPENINMIHHPEPMNTISNINA
jgi:hypothetical protein